MHVDEKQRIIFLMRKVIDEEKLPQPKRILLRCQYRGLIRTKGRCRSNKFRDSYNITLQTTQCKFTPDIEGKWINKQGVRLNKSMVPVPLKDLLYTAAHEIAHLKFWDHNAQHKCYSELLYIRLLEVQNEAV